MTQFQTCPRYYDDKQSDKVSWTLDTKLCLLECKQGFSKICPSDLVFDPPWPIFKFDLDIMIISILIQFHDLWIKTVSSKVYLCFFLRFDLAT